jgi:hypothetical protein
MAKLQIIDSKGKVALNKTPRTSTLALPFNLVGVVDSGYSALTKSIAAIQKDMYAIEDQNQVNEVMPDINKKVTEIYSKYKNSTDIENAPSKFENELNIKNFELLLKDKNKTVQTLLTNKIAESKSELVAKLVSQISTNVSEKFLFDLGKNFDTAISLMISSDQATMAKGTIMFENLAKNDAYASTIGYKEYKELVKVKTNLKNKLLLNAQLQINPQVILENQKSLIEDVGIDAAKTYISEAENAIIDKRAQKDKKERLELLQTQTSQIGAFSEVALRIKNAQDFPESEIAQNEMPTITELYTMYENELLTEPMFIRLSTFLADPENDGTTMEEIHNSITVQLYSAKTIQQLDEIKNSYVMDNDLLVQMAMEDISAFNAIIDKGKKDFQSHRDFQHYSKMIDRNIAMMTFTGYDKAQEKSETATRKQEIQNSFKNKVLNGMKPEDAYFEVVLEEFDDKAIPKLNLLSFPVKNVDWAAELDKDPKYFDTVANQLLEKYKISNKSVFDAKELMDDLNKIDFVKTIFRIRYAVAPIKKGSTKSEHDQKMEFATTTSNAAGVINFDPGD